MSARRRSTNVPSPESVHQRVEEAEAHRQRVRVRSRQSAEACQEDGRIRRQPVASFSDATNRVLQGGSQAHRPAASGVENQSPLDAHPTTVSTRISKTICDFA